MAVASNDHQFARGRGGLESSRLRQSRGRDVPYRPAEEHEADIEDARIESLERTDVRWRAWREAKDGRRDPTPHARWTDPEHSD